MVKPHHSDRSPRTSAIRGRRRHVRARARLRTCAELAPGVIAEAPDITLLGYSANVIRADVYLRPGDHGHAFRVGDLLELRRRCAGLPMTTGEPTAKLGDADARAILKAIAVIEVGGHAPSVRSGQRDEAG